MSFGWAPAAGMLGAGGVMLRSRGGRWRLRDWRLRTKLTALLLVPLLLAGVLGALRVTELVGKARTFEALARQIGFAQQLGLIVYDLQRERNLVTALLSSGGNANRTGLQTQIQRVDTAVAELRTGDFRAVVLSTGVDGRPVSAREAALSRLSGLAAMRQATFQPSAAPGDVGTGAPVGSYSEVITGLLDLHRGVLDGVSEPLSRQAVGVTALAVAKEQASWQHAVLLTGILSGVLSTEQQVTLRAADVRFDVAADEFGRAVSGTQGQLFLDTRAVGDRKRLLDAALDRAQRAVPLETVPGDWNSAAVGTVESIRQGEVNLLNELRAAAVARGDRAWYTAFSTGIAVAVFLVLAVLLLAVVVRSMLQPLRTLRTAAFDVADRRLPEAVEQVQATDGTSGPATVEPVPVHSREEVGQVARAFDTVHMQAVRLATEQAQLRSSLNDIVLNLSGRGQDLVERQLQLISELHSTVSDPAVGTSLSQLDRLAVRMRRHSDNLLVLAGGTARSGAEGSVAVPEVFGRAVSEVEQYQRVTVGRAPAAAVAGPVVKDLVHLIAELLDNAIVAADAAPQGATVTLGGELANDNSLRVEITDSGLGLPPDQLQAINARLASVPAVEGTAADQMGMLVVRGLAARHGITVRLGPGPDGSGIIATVLLPASLVTADLRPSVDMSTSVTSPMPKVPKVGAVSRNRGFDGSAGALAAPSWNGNSASLPLQVSVVDEAATADLFSPSSIGLVTSPGGRPRTAQEEWLELFGSPESRTGTTAEISIEREPVLDPLGGSTPMAGVPGAGQHQEVREEIFEMVSAWFRERQAASALTNSASATATEPEWRSPLDEGWHAAQALRTPVDHELTQAGLPMRRPRANLVSGAGGSGLPEPMPAAPARVPDAVRARLSRYQRGLRVGRHARIGPDDHGPDVNGLDSPTVEQPACIDTPYRSFEQ